MMIAVLMTNLQRSPLPLQRSLLQWLVMVPKRLSLTAAALTVARTMNLMRMK
jgi:hypothetical protein